MIAAQSSKLWLTGDHQRADSRITWRPAPGERHLRSIGAVSTWALRSSICGWYHAVEACRTAAPAAAKIRLRRGQMRITGHQLHDLGPTRGDHDTLHGQPIQSQQTRRVIATVGLLSLLQNTARIQQSWVTLVQAHRIRLPGQDRRAVKGIPQSGCNNKRLRLIGYRPYFSLPLDLFRSLSNGMKRNRIHE